MTTTLLNSRTYLGADTGSDEHLFYINKVKTEPIMSQMTYHPTNIRKNLASFHMTHSLLPATTTAKNCLIVQMHYHIVIGTPSFVCHVSCPFPHSHCSNKKIQPILFCLALLLKCDCYFTMCYEFLLTAKATGDCIRICVRTQ